MRTYTLKVNVSSADPTELDKNILIEHLEEDIKDACDRDRNESRIRFVSLVLEEE